MLHVNNGTSSRLCFVLFLQLLCGILQLNIRSFLPSGFSRIIVKFLRISFIRNYILNSSFHEPFSVSSSIHHLTLVMISSPLLQYHASVLVLKEFWLTAFYSRGRKIRCDGAKPVCYNCRQRNTDACEYDSVPKRRGPDRIAGARQRHRTGKSALFYSEKGPRQRRSRSTRDKEEIVSEYSVWHLSETYPSLLRKVLAYGNR